MFRRFVSFLSVLAALALLPPVAAGAQQTGTILGRVTNQAGRPLADARVQVIGTTRGASTADDGSFRILGIPVGTAQIRATRLGYMAQTRPVNVRVAESSEQLFSLVETATTLDQVVVTATGETQRRRESGASVGNIDTSSFNVVAAPSLATILSSRTAGVTIQHSSGTTGAGSRTRIRGANSVSLNNDPLIIVDGIRVNNASSGAASFNIGVGGQQINRLDDFNPEDIESIDVIKGPAAAALYGTAAANGVIQIKTKKGRAGKTRWNTYEEYGSVKDNFDYPANYNQIGRRIPTPAAPAVDTTQGCTLERQVRAQYLAANGCVPVTDSLLTWNPIENVSPFTNGWRQTHGLSVNGGNDQTTYFLAGEYEREQGVYTINKLRRVSGRSNIRMQLRSDLDASLSLGLLRNTIRLPNNDNSAFGAIAGGYLGKAYDCSPTTYKTNLYCGVDSLGRGYFNANIPSTQFFNVNDNQQLDRLTTSLQANWTPLTWLRGTGTMGADIVNRVDQELIPPNKVFFSQTTAEGSRLQDRRRIPTYNVSGSMTATYAVPPMAGLSDLNGSSTIGSQYVREDTRSTLAQGFVLTGGTGSLNGTSARFRVGETNQEIITVGFFGQQQVTYKDRLFLTGAIRSDRNSSFGTDFKWVLYPAASVSWVISEEGFFPKSKFIDQLRLRTAWGQSGQRPVFRQAATFFEPVAFRQGAAEVAAFTVGGTGNVKLRPEKTTEFEGGFEGSFVDNRFSLELTGYHKSTADAILAERLAPSLGVTETRLRNVGKVINKGIEALATVNPVRMENVEWSTTITVSANQNKLTEGGPGFNPILQGFSGTQQHRVGYPLGAFFERKIVGYNDYDANGILTRLNCPTYESANPQIFGGPRCEVVLSDSVEYLGSPLPTREMTFNTALGLFKYARITTLFDYRGGFKIFNLTNDFRCISIAVPNCKQVYDASAPLSEQVKLVARQMGAETGFIEDAGFVKWRELALTLTAPTEWARRIKSDQLSITFAGRNLATWSDYGGLDPEVNAGNGTAFTTADFLTQPPVRYFVTRINVNF